MIHNSTQVQEQRTNNQSTLNLQLSVCRFSAKGAACEIDSFVPITAVT
jgi:hypothetical protein